MPRIKKKAADIKPEPIATLQAIKLGLVTLNVYLKRDEYAGMEEVRQAYLDKTGVKLSMSKLIRFCLGMELKRWTPAEMVDRLRKKEF